MIYSTSPHPLSVLSYKSTTAGRAPTVDTRSRPAANTDASQAPTSATGLQRALKARDYLAQLLEGGAEDRKAQAQGRLEEAKQKLALLKRWGFNPETVARGAAQLARELRAAADDFAAAATSGSGASSGSAEAEGANNASLPPAYRDMMEAGPQAARISRGDRDTIEAFKSTLRQIKQLLEKAVRELRQEKSSQGTDAGNAMAAIEDALSALDGVTGEASFHPASFSIMI